MNDDVQDEDALSQAAQWYARLNTLPVSRDTLDAFFAWRRIPGNREAFGKIDEFDTRARRLAGRPAIEVAAERAWARGRSHRWTARPALRLATLCAGLALVAGIGWSRWRIDRESFSTGIGQRREIALEDGSTIMLDTDTRLSIRFSSGARDVRLEQGQAFFTVAHDTARPFTVRAGDDSVVATGTQFDVRRSGSDILVALLRGGVDIWSNDKPTAHLAPGQQWRASSNGMPAIEPVAYDRISAWTSGRIVLDEVPLADAIAEANRYLPHPIILDAPNYAQARFGGSLNAGDAQAFVVAVSAILPLTAVKDETGAIHLREKTEPGSAAI
jgi:transmembrane sensor